ncbi:MAG: CerR family C-terminal domain-containing protein [Cyanobacteria bacterium P01_G01_bin.38]
MNKNNSLHSSSQRRGEEARQRLIEAGIEIFGTHGYESASTRSIVEKAGVNLGAIPYYFDNKKGLYRAVAKHIATHLNDPMIDTAIAQIDHKVKTSSLSTEQALELMHELFDAFITTLLSADRPELWTQFIFRELMEPSSVFDILNERVVKKTISPCAALIGKILDQPADSAECTVRAFSLFGQVLIFRMLRESTLRSLGWKAFDSDHLDLIRNIVHQQVDDALRAQVK